MASHDETPQGELAPRRPRRRSLLTRLTGLLLLVLVGAAIWVWANRERLADDYIAETLADLGVEASYEIERVGPRHQVFTNIVVGDPDRPDLTIERIEAWIEPRLGIPGIGRLRVVRPRLYGTYMGGQLSFGALDPVLFPEEEVEPFSLPDMVLELVDGRALLESDYGPAGAKLAGKGNLRGGFAGELAVAAPRLSGEGCEAERASLYGRVTIDAERPRLAGPLRLPELRCGEMELALSDAALLLDVTGDRTLKGFAGNGRLRTGTLTYQGNRIAGMEGETELAWRNQGLTSDYDVVAREVATAPAEIGELDLSGSLRTREGLAFVEWQGELGGSGLRPGTGFDRRLAQTADAAGNSLLGPIIERLRHQLQAEGRASTLAAQFILRRSESGTSLVIPTGSLRGTSGATVLSVSRFQFGDTEEGPRFFGNFLTGGEGLPRIAGRMERQVDGDLVLRLRMAEYGAGGGSLAIPEMVVVQGDGGALGIAGSVEANGPLPGGSARGLRLPVSGLYSSDRGLSLWRSCTDIRFDRLTLADLTLERRGLTLCPPAGSAIVQMRGDDLRIAAGAPGLDLAGRLGDTPIRLSSGAVGFAWPGTLAARAVDVELGPQESASSFAIADLVAQLGGEIAGSFSDANIHLDAVPLDLVETQGNWALDGDGFTISDAAFQLQDRQSPQRFAPLVASGGRLRLADRRITADATLREPQTGRAVTRVDLVHDLANGSGKALLAIDGLRFDGRLQPDTLTPLALGVIATTYGTLTGNGRIDWDEGGVTSSGRFSTDWLDFAAAFGPVQGASGTVEFTDLLGLTTAPGQTLRIASFNPGIEVTEGVFSFHLVDGELLAVEGGRWPFLGGTLTLLPVNLAIGVEEVRRYVIEIEGLDAGRFVERMELANIAAIGTFDGTLPLVFDQQGGRIERGLLAARAPGGNISYVGDLTYEDLSLIANFAFDALRSLDYQTMHVAMEGPLTGEIVTRVRFSGVRQGAGTKKNLVTRQLAKLPIQFNVNVRASFYRLLTDMRSMYDPSSVKDPRDPDVGLLDAQGSVIRRETRGYVASPAAGTPIPDEPDIQPPDSEISS